MKVVYNDDYLSLFHEAEELLKNNGHPDITIQDLPSYYSVIDELAKIGGPKYLRVPIDEEPFEIDTNTRKINIPADITGNKWVIGVKDDHMAEVLYFTIDRFFDDTDLAVCFPREGDSVHKGQTYVQWKNGAAVGLDPVHYVQIDESRIIFGWILHDVITKASGDITFSIRFQYHKVGTSTGPDLNSEVLYSFNTLPATCKLLPNLIENMPVDSIGDLKVENVLDQTVFRPHFSGVFDNTLGPKAYIATDLSSPMDLNEEGSAELSVRATGSGELTYKWYRNGEFIEGAEGASYTANRYGVYTVQVGNQYAENAIRWTESNPCDIPEACELRFAENGNITDRGYANGLTALRVNVEYVPDDYGRRIGNISYVWHRDALEGENFGSDGEGHPITTEVIEGANNATYTPADGKVGYYYVEATNTHNGDLSKVLVSDKCVMKNRAVAPNRVTINYNEDTGVITADVEMEHKYDLYYRWFQEGGISTQAELNKNTYKPTMNGVYYCKVYQHVYPEFKNLESISESTLSNQIEVSNLE